MLFSVALQRLRRLLRLLLLRATCLRRMCYMIATPLSPHSGSLPGCCLPWQLVRALISILKRLYKIQQAAIQRAKQQQQTKSRHYPPCNPAAHPSLPPPFHLPPAQTACLQLRLPHRLHVSVCCALYPAASDSAGKATAYRSKPSTVHIGAPYMKTLLL